MDTDIDLKLVNKMIDRAKMALMLGTATTFFSALLANLKLDITMAVPTAATNGVSLSINPTFILKLPPEHVLGVMLHEVMHVALNHCNMIYYEHCDKKILNMAMDYYINLWITRLGYELPSWVLLDDKFDDMSTMEIYEELMKDPPDTEDFDMDVMTCPADMTDAEYAEKVTSNVIKAVYQAQRAKDAGSIPGEVLITLEEILNPKLPWQVILGNYLTDYSKDDYTFSRPNRRYMPDFYMPTLWSETLKQVSAGCDVSCSMEDPDISSIFCELRYIWDVMKPDRMRVMTFDTKVHLNDVFTEGDTLKELVLEGGGGTNVQPLLDSIREEKPVFALIFTDGYFQTPNMDGIETDVYWIILDNPGFTPPHGIVIPFN